MGRVPRESGRDQGPDRFARMFTDLESQAAAHSGLDDLAEAEALQLAEIARITWADRLRALPSAQVELPDGMVIAGHVEAVLTDGVHLRGSAHEWIVHAEAVQSLRGLGGRITHASRIEQRLSVASILRRWFDEGSHVQCLSARGPREGVIVRVGADHFDLDEQARGDLARGDLDREERDQGEGRGRCTLPIARVWAVRRW